MNLNATKAHSRASTTTESTEYSTWKQEKHRKGFILLSSSSKDSMFLLHFIFVRYPTKVNYHLLPLPQVSPPLLVSLYYFDSTVRLITEYNMLHALGYYSASTAKFIIKVRCTTYL